MKRLVYAAIRALILRISRPLEDPPAGATLIIAPHPDDEALGCSGLIATRRAAQRDVHIVYLTDGSASHQGHPAVTPQDLAGLRAREAADAMRVLGVPETALHFLQARDGQLPHLDRSEAGTLCAALRKIFSRVQPVEICLPFRQDGSTEHEAAFALIGRAMAESKLAARILEYPVWSWWRAVLLVRPLMGGRRVKRIRFPQHRQRKADALSRYRSQFAPLAPWTKAVLSEEFRRLFTNDEEIFFADL